MFLLFVNDIYFIITGQRISFLPVIDYRDKINIILTLAIALFAAVEGYSTYLQVLLANKRNKIEDLRNELATAYGPLYTIMSYAWEVSKDSKTGENIVKLDSEDKKKLDSIFATYPFMFEPMIYNLWREKIQKLESSSFRVMPLRDGLKQIPLYHIPEQFRNRLNDEYDRKVKEYNKLLKKE